MSDPFPSESGEARGSNPDGVRTYRGRTIEELIPQIKAELGPDAIILREREGLTGGIGGFFAQRCVEIDAQAAPRVNIYDDDYDDYDEDAELSEAQQAELDAEFASAPPFRAELTAGPTGSEIPPASAVPPASVVPPASAIPPSVPELTAPEPPAVAPPPPAVAPPPPAAPESPTAAPEPAAVTPPAATAPAPEPQEVNAHLTGPAGPVNGAGPSAAPPPAPPVSPFLDEASFAARLEEASLGGYPFAEEAEPEVEPVAEAEPAAALENPAFIAFDDLWSAAEVAPEAEPEPRPQPEPEAGAEPKPQPEPEPEPQPEPEPEPLPEPEPEPLPEPEPEPRPEPEPELEPVAAADPVPTPEPEPAAEPAPEPDPARPAPDPAPWLAFAAESPPAASPSGLPAAPLPPLPGPTNPYAAPRPVNPYIGRSARRRGGLLPAAERMLRAALDATSAANDRREFEFQARMAGAPYTPALPAGHVAPMPPVAPTAPIPPADRQPELERRLISTGLSPSRAATLVRAAVSRRGAFSTAGEIAGDVRGMIATLLSGPAPLAAGSGAIAVVGAGGSGKTRSVAALAVAQARAGALVSVASLGTPGREDVLGELLYGEAVNIIPAMRTRATARAVGSARERGLVIVDTASAAPGDTATIETMAAALNGFGLDGIYLAVPATLSGGAGAKLIDSFSAFEITGMIATHVDETDQLGVIAELAMQTGIPISYTHAGLELQNAIVAADAQHIAAGLI